LSFRGAIRYPRIIPPHFGNYGPTAVLANTNMRLQTDENPISNHNRYVRARDETGKGRRWRARGGVGNWTLTHRQIEIPRRHASRFARPVQNPDSAPRPGISQGSLTVNFQGLGQGWGRFNQSSNDTLSRQSCCWSRLVRGLVLVRSNLLGRARAQ